LTPPLFSTYIQVINGKQHFTSLHGKVGLLNFLLSLASPTLGILSFKYLGIYNKLPDTWQPYTKWAHRFLAVSTWLLALVTMQLDLPHSAVFEGIFCRLWQLAVVVLGVSMILIIRRGDASSSGNSVSFGSLPTVGSFIAGGGGDAGTSTKHH